MWKNETTFCAKQNNSTELNHSKLAALIWRFKRQITVTNFCTVTDFENESKEKGTDEWNFLYRAAISRPKEQYNRSWNGQVGRVESFFKANAQGVSPLDELVGEKVTPENTRIYICGYQGTIDGVMDYVDDRGFVNRDNPHEDGTFEVKYESYG